MLYERLYEDNVAGKVTDSFFMELSHKYENEKSELIALSDALGARFEVKFGGGDEFRGSIVVDAIDFIAVKSYKAKGKRLSNFTIESITEIEPREIEDDETQEPQVVEGEAPEDEEELEAERSDDEVRDEINGQQRIF